jgi:hypothetical protein
MSFFDNMTRHIGIPNLLFVLLLNQSGALHLLYRPPYESNLKDFRKSFPLHIHSFREFRIALNVLYQKQFSNLTSRASSIHPDRLIKLKQRILDAHTSSNNKVQAWEIAMTPSAAKDFLLDLGLQCYSLAMNPEISNIA